MNSSIGIALLLLFASAHSDSGVKQSNYNELEIREQINELNKARLEVAKKENVANMHEVTFDPTLESKIKKMTCDDMTANGPDYVVFGFLEIVGAAIALKSKTKEVDLKLPPFHPLQTKIACGTRATKCDDVLSEICLMGPKNSPVKPSEIKKGSPGTGCSGGDGSSGLCMGGGVSSASTPMTLLSLVIALIMA
ncbi:hypothetical protein GCK72_003203 [Caenorhabditis remanei]|uniref:Uncharacterized protein n=1 Tax=Caenorhabditis remanei TaxID=31234 RepID=A0A6A5HXT2_CAERE|nr:hypothetical protein GCK72_003203 [Caenorhabditis remanei]KAF1771377.1 hypothetical protein GCK72_003203 [Caenorhabditis remanei]